MKKHRKKGHKKRKQRQHVPQPTPQIIEEKKEKHFSVIIQKIKKIVPKFFHNKIFITISCIIFIFLILVIGLYKYINTNEEAAARFTDDTLRPMFGSQQTISLEAVFYNVQDKISQLKYKLHGSPNNRIFFPENVLGISTQSAKPNSTFSLDPIASLSATSNIPEEGKWESLVSSPEGVLIAKTIVQPDPDRPYAVVDLVKMNMHVLHMNAVAGLQQPGGPEKPGPGMVPTDIQQTNKLLAAFNGGFQKKDGYYGMIVGDTTYLPLQKGLATLVIYKDTQPNIMRYNEQSFGKDVIAIRQNGPMLIENAQIVASSSAWNMQTWGLTTTNSMYTWRSGLGVTKDGNLVYASGSFLVPDTLAKALQAAGAINAMQLDINHFWVRYVLFNTLGRGEYESKSLEDTMENGGYDYLHGYQKDFFYLYKK